MSRLLRTTLRIVAIACLGGQVAGCMSRLPGPPGLAIETDGRCVYRDGLATDPATGESLPVRERFCGGRPRVAG